MVHNSRTKGPRTHVCINAALSLFYVRNTTLNFVYFRNALYNVQYWLAGDTTNMYLHLIFCRENCYSVTVPTEKIMEFSTFSLNIVFKCPCVTRSL